MIFRYYLVYNALKIEKGNKYTGKIIYHQINRCSLSSKYLGSSKMTSNQPLSNASFRKNSVLALTVATNVKDNEEESKNNPLCR